jgi:hypothetical protein
VDQACFLPLADAYDRIHPDQGVFLERLEEWLRETNPRGTEKKKG